MFARNLAAFFSGFAFCFLAFAGAVQAAEKAPPASLLWVGNSFFYYNNSMHNFLLGFVRADGRTDARGTSVTISGSGIEWHDMKSYLRPDGIGRYSFVGDNEIVFNKPGRQFDGVILMDCSQCPVHPKLKDTFYKFAKKHARTIRANGAEPILFMSWAYKDKPEMTQQLADAYGAAGAQNKARVIPAGLAFANAVKARPDLELYQRDKRHPTLAGTYLAAATTYATIYGKSPVGNTFISGLDAPTAAFLQEIAADTAAAYGRK
jgi:hypothetical protein